MILTRNIKAHSWCPVDSCEISVVPNLPVVRSVFLLKTEVSLVRVLAILVLPVDNKLTK